ncbi:hypothetical protein [Laspinema palackyanum]|uniref:hypothetical protein n=1 Tax=Laspinema palackyanum TaxID=3231601 RepID=UPI00345DD363|nr:hypothetical protein [Laspinema sp. D2c]
MTEPDRLNLLDTDYAALVAGDYDPNLEQLMKDAVLLTRLVGLPQHRPLTTEQTGKRLR